MWIIRLMLFAVWISLPIIWLLTEPTINNINLAWGIGVIAGALVVGGIWWFEYTKQKQKEGG